MIGSRFSLFNFSIFEILFENSDTIFFALSSINFISSWLIDTLSWIMYLELLYISSKVLALFFRNANDDLILSPFSLVIFFLKFTLYI